MFRRKLCFVLYKPLRFMALMSIFLTACSHTNFTNEPEIEIDKLSQSILSLSSEITSEEANITSQVLITTAMSLADEYNMASPPLYHNMLVKLGLRKRGLCCHWAEDLHAELRELSIVSLKFDWLVARPGSELREHNTVVIFPAAATWEKGLVFDPWRNAGSPYWTEARGDKYPWQLHPLSGQWEILRCK